MTQFLRPEALRLLSRWREPALGAALAALGLWIATRGGWLLPAVGLPCAALGVSWVVLALRRQRFAPDIASPGLVEIDEGRLRYLHPRMPGDISLTELSELRLLTLRGRSVWRLRDLSGAVLLVPLDASGAEHLFDAFAALPGLTSAGLVAALTPQVIGSTLPTAAMQDRLVWRRSGQGLAPR